MPDGERNYQLVGAVVLAAGQSRRMGTPKMVLPWASRTVIEQVVQTLLDAGISEIIVVTGGAGEAVEAALRSYQVNVLPNQAYADTEMVTSLQVGLNALSPGCEAALIVLGDQPTITDEVVSQVVDAYLRTGAAIAIPSYQMHRGHPWLVRRNLWPGILGLTKDQTLRDFLNENKDQIAYIHVNTPSVLTDIDTPDDYRRLRPK